MIVCACVCVCVCFQMAVDSGKTIELAGLGRPFSLGMLYDCRNDSLIPGKHNITESRVEWTRQELLLSLF